jgi:hypothetical protein
MILLKKDTRIRTEFVDANGLTFEGDKCGAGLKLAIYYRAQVSNQWFQRATAIACLSADLVSPHAPRYHGQVEIGLYSKALRIANYSY